ncbi:proline hydroxylase [Kiloniella spongiae]|uniref:Proline hydroxylase n=1 Tax=Kiloniella spongiae TaxID=1489064 RepID=A0A0H2MAC1_9PROT|nr:2OG-Fe(II) oxygenase [Kiloniella spongiae]KLN59126.1 proline hydroxylase [Kiloniella spongiae]
MTLFENLSTAEISTDRLSCAISGEEITHNLDEKGYAILKGVLSESVCVALARNYDADGPYRSRVVMSRHGFGQGEYKYFNYPLPDLIACLRSELYEPLAQISNRWNEQMNVDQRFPKTHQQYLDLCYKAGQVKATPLLLQYGSGDYNCLHQDVYGELVFPLQMACLLSKPGQDFTGGEFVLTEQRPRMQSRVEVIPLDQGDAVIFPVRHRPKQGTRGTYRVNMRHGVSEIRSGQRHTLGIIFHDAQ